MLTSMIAVQLVKRRRPRQGEDAASLHDYSYRYSVRVKRGETAIPIQVCIKALVSIFGIGTARLERVRASLAKTGLPSLSQQGKHSTRPLAFTDEIRQTITEHIKSFRGRKSHYSLHDTRRLYLPEDLNVCKMHSLYQERHPEHSVSREIYRNVFVEKFNLSFGYPRKDTCSTCDGLAVKLEDANTPAPELTQHVQERELHLRKAKIFYERKAAARQDAQISENKAAIAFDHAKNMSCPNIATNDVYYRRQLSIYMFNVHSLSDDGVHLFCYDETEGKKGADDVTSMLLHYFESILPQEITHLQLFCDSCAGQNKNWTVIRFLHWIVTVRKRFQEVKISFPIRGHSYMECDRDMTVINQKVRAERPNDWFVEFSNCRKKPSAFNVIQMTHDKFQTVSDHVKNFYRASCPIPTRPLREIVFNQNSPRTMEYRENWNGPFYTAVLTKPVGKRTTARQQPLTQLYSARLPISLAKFKDLQVLKAFCNTAAQEYFSAIPHQSAEVGGTDSDSE